MSRGGPVAAVDLRTRVGSVMLDNPIMTASGTSGHGAELAAYMDLSRLGAVVVKSVSAEGWGGNPTPRLVPLGTGVGMLNSVGLQNPGVEKWLASELPALTRTGARVVASIWGFTAESFGRAARAIAEAIGDPASGSSPARAIVAVEANISCPNIEDRRQMFAHSATGVHEAVGAAVDSVGGRVPIWAKMSPNVTDLPGLAEQAMAAGAEAVNPINTVMGMAIDPATGVFRLGAGGGGLSGPAIHPVAVRAVYECRQALPGAAIVGVGGVTTGEDAAELLVAGADAVQVGTATFADPRAPARVLAELASWCAERGIWTIDELKGRAHERL
jgi:dihydroorotate dehydrogenase (NAD+) catalytic subunit